MKVWKRVFISIQRRLNQTLTMFFVVFLLGNILFAAIAVRQTSTQVEKNLKSRIPSTIRISENRDKIPSWYQHERLIELMNDIKDDDSITDMVLFTSLQGAENLTVTETSMSYGYDTSYCIDDYSMLDYIEISNGRIFTKEEFDAGDYKIILDDDKAWMYEIGDKYKIQIYDYSILNYDKPSYIVEMVEEVEFEVIGFTSEITYNEQGITLTQYQNPIILKKCADEIIAKQKDLFDAHSIKDKSIYNEYMSSRDWRLHERVEKVIINIDGVDAVDELETIIKKSEKYGNAAFVLETSANDFRYIQAPLENLEALTNVTMVASTILVVVLLGLISILFIRNRTKEIGILMALGERKHKLFIQFTLEIILVGMLSSSCAMISGNKLGSFISNEFMRIQIDTEAELEYQEDNKGAMTQLDMLEAYNVELNIEYIITIYISSIVILLVSTLVPMFFVLKTNPKKVLL